MLTTTTPTARAFAAYTAALERIAHRGDTNTARVTAERRAAERFDEKMRSALGAPKGAQVLQRGSQLLLDLADGREPIATVSRLDADNYLVTGGEGHQQVIVANVALARRLLWERFRRQS